MLKPALDCEELQAVTFAFGVVIGIIICAFIAACFKANRKTQERKP
jgi:uncharacterized membrane protein YciS (DUF1049 family)